MPSPKTECIECNPFSVTSFTGSHFPQDWDLIQKALFWAPHPVIGNDGLERRISTQGWGAVSTQHPVLESCTRSTWVNLSSNKDKLCFDTRGNISVTISSKMRGRKVWEDSNPAESHVTLREPQCGSRENRPKSQTVESWLPALPHTLRVTFVKKKTTVPKWHLLGQVAKRGLDT